MAESSGGMGRTVPEGQSAGVREIYFSDLLKIIKI